MVGHLALTNARATARSSKLKRCPSIQREFCGGAGAPFRAPLGGKTAHYAFRLQMRL